MYAYGIGRRIYYDNSIYEGNFFHGQAHGFGRRIFKNGDWYVGWFSYGTFNGYGYRRTYQTDEVGLWYDGKFVASGIGAVVAYDKTKLQA